MRYIFIFFSALLLLYLLWPMPSSIDVVSSLPGEVAQSTLEGDTIQVPNVKAYFSNHYRNYVTSFYRDDLQNLFKFPFPPLRLNHPPEHAFIYIKDQTQSTYLEEYLYPLKGSLFVNGMEPFYESKGLSSSAYENNHQPKYYGAVEFVQDDQKFDTKTTLRYYPSSVVSRIINWLGINLSIVGLFIVGRKIIFK